MYLLHVREQVVKKMETLEKSYFSAIQQDILSLRREYFPPGKKCKRLQGEQKDFYRLRNGPYRIIYQVNHQKKLITVLRLFHRGEGY